MFSPRSAEHHCLMRLATDIELGFSVLAAQATYRWILREYVLVSRRPPGGKMQGEKERKRIKVREERKRNDLLLRQIRHGTKRHFGFNFIVLHGSVNYGL